MPQASEVSVTAMDHEQHDHDTHRSQIADQHAMADQQLKRDQHAGHDQHAEREQHPGHDKHAGHSVAMFRDRFWLCAAADRPDPRLVGDHAPRPASTTPPPTFPRSRIASPPVFGTAVFLYSGLPFLKGGVREIRGSAAGDDAPHLARDRRRVRIERRVARPAALDLEFWWELALLIDVMLLGHWQEMKALGQASSALDASPPWFPTSPRPVEVDGNPDRSGAVELAGGRCSSSFDSGGRMPADGVVEDRPNRRRRVHDHGRVSPGRACRRRARRRGNRSLPTASSAFASVPSATTRRSPASAASSPTRRRRSPGPRRWPTELPPSCSTSPWLRLSSRSPSGLSLGSTGEAVERTVTVFVISCPHALGLAIPLVIAISTSMSARAGILVKDRLALERMRVVDAVLFDKTGTLTRGEPVVVDVAAIGNRRSRHRPAPRLRRRGRQRTPFGSRDRSRGRGIWRNAGRFGVPLADRSGGRRHRSMAATVAVGGPSLLRELARSSPRPQLASET